VVRDYQLRFLVLLSASELVTELESESWLVSESELVLVLVLELKLELLYSTTFYFIYAIRQSTCIILAVCYFFLAAAFIITATRVTVILNMVILFIVIQCFSSTDLIHHEVMVNKSQLFWIQW
jgi:hypothetical protein